MRRFVLFFALLFTATLFSAAAAPTPEAILVIVGDQHSAYERTAQFVAQVDRLKSENPGVPLAVLIDGDAMEFGNVVARRTAGAIDFAMFTALAQRAPTILNFGNHEPEFHDVAETVQRIQATGVIVISGNLRDPATQKAYAPASTRLKLGEREAVVVGVATDWLATYRVAVRPQLDLADPVVWARANFSPLLGANATPLARESRNRGPATLPIVLSHAGVRPDREMLKLVPDGTLFAGAHDHLRFVHRASRTVYVHSGSWMEFITIARLQRAATGELQWEIDQLPLLDATPGDPALAKLVRDTLAQHLTAEETALVGRTARAFTPTDAAAFAVEAVRAAARADVAVIGATTFGAGLPAGDVTRYAFDACVRFENSLCFAEVEGRELEKILARTNQGPTTPFAEREGENLLAARRPGLQLEAGKRYVLVVPDWIMRNAKRYLGETPPTFVEKPELKVKAAVLKALTDPR